MNNKKLIKKLYKNNARLLLESKYLIEILIDLLEDDGKVFTLLTRLLNNCSYVFNTTERLRKIAQTDLS